MPTTKSNLLELTAEVVAAYLSRNSAPIDQLPTLINTVHQTLSGLRAEQPASEPPTPAVSVRKSIQPDYLICLEDGKKLKMLKRHLMTAYGMTPADYRAKWGLPADYPMTAPNYSEKRSEFAKKNELGKRGGRRKSKKG
jgi:predicted transcriptional regulator